MKNKNIKKFIAMEGFRSAIVIFSSVIYSIAVLWFLDPANIYAGGIAGLSQLIVDTFNEKLNMHLNLGLIVFLFNLPLFLIALKFISIRFAIYSAMSILVQTICMSGIIGIPDFATTNPDNFLLFAIIGGFITGLGAALALRFGTSTGGIDMIGQALAFKKNISIGYFNLIFNCLIAIVAAIVFHEPFVFFYTVVRIIITSVVTDKIHTAYNFMRLEIVTCHGDEIAKELLDQIGHGITITSGVGAFTQTDKQILITVVSSYETYQANEIIKKIDNKAFVSTTPVKKVFGLFKRKTIA